MKKTLILLFAITSLFACKKDITEEQLSFIDDFEQSWSAIDFASFLHWDLASTPQIQKEATLNNDVAYGFNRSKLAWYNISADFFNHNAPNHLTANDKSNHLMREIYINEIYPYYVPEYSIYPRLSVLNLAYYPDERGPYNYDVSGRAGISEGINADGKLNAPESRWAGIMTDLPTRNFEVSNIEFWLMDPFVYEPNHAGGELYFNLGDVSEDILKDSRNAFEYGLTGIVDTTVWGRVPVAEAIIDAFSAEAEERRKQDVGLDGLSDEDERSFFGRGGVTNYLGEILNIYGIESSAYENAYKDPSSDNYHYFRGTDYDKLQLNILDRYKHYNGFENNSRVREDEPEDYSTSGSLLPDMEDLNLNKILNGNESYFQYKVLLTPEKMKVGENYIVDKIVNTAERANGETNSVTWYHFQIPLNDPRNRETVGNIQNFKSIRFLRMFLKGFNEDIVLRFGGMLFTKAVWKNYVLPLNESNVSEEIGTSLYLFYVNIEENRNKQPINYIPPPGVEYGIDPNNPEMKFLNEQSLMLRVNNLQDGDARGVYRDFQLDFQEYKKIHLFVHAEAVDNQNIVDGEIAAFVRFFTDDFNNYFEYEVPLKITNTDDLPTKTSNDDINYKQAVWPKDNMFEIAIDKLGTTKQSGSLTDGKNRITVVGNPDISRISSIMLGVRNLKNTSQDDGEPKSVEVWFNELRLSY